MKYYSKIILLIIIIINYYTPCCANSPLKIKSLFQSDLVIDVFYKSHENLIRGSDVYLADDPKGQKTLIGSVTSVSLVEPQMSKVEINIDKKYRDKIYETTQFVLVSNLFSENSNAYIAVISSLDTPDKNFLKSGSSVKGTTFLEYKIATAGEGFKKMIYGVEKQSQELLSQLEEYMDSFNTEALHKGLDELANQIKQFSKEQKKAFKNDVLPTIRNMFNSMMKQLEGQTNKEKSKDLKKQLKEIEELVDV